MYKTLAQELDLCRIKMFVLITGILPKHNTYSKQFSVSFDSYIKVDTDLLIDYLHTMPIEDIEPLQKVIYSQCCEHISLERNLKLLKADGLDIDLYQDNDRLWSLSMEDLAYVINNIKDANVRYTDKDLECVELDGWRY